jgi:hypothetical protein
LIVAAKVEVINVGKLKSSIRRSFTRRIERKIVFVFLGGEFIVPRIPRFDGALQGLPYIAFAPRGECREGDREEEKEERRS